MTGFKSTEPGPHARSPVLPGSPSCFLPSPADLGTPSPPLARPLSATGTLSLKLRLGNTLHKQKFWFLQKDLGLQNQASRKILHQKSFSVFKKGNRPPLTEAKPKDHLK